MLYSLIPEKFRKLFHSKTNHKAINQKSIENKNISNKQKLSKSKTKSFSDTLEDNAKNDYFKDFDEFLQKLNNLEKSLIDNPSEMSVKKYRDSISVFLKKMSRNYQKFEFYRRRKGTYRIWKVIDHKLEELYKGVVTKQLKGMMLLGDLKQIKGLIVDMKVGKEV